MATSATATRSSDLASRRERAAELYRHGAGLKEIAAEFGVSVGTIAYDLERMGVARRRGGRPQIHPTPERRSCKNPDCGREFRPRPDHVARGYGLFCSMECYHRYVEAGRWLVCANHGGPMWVRERDIRRAEARGKSNWNLFCSKSCAMAYRWKHGISIGDQFIVMRHGRVRQVWKGRWAGRLGAPSGRGGGRPSKVSEEARGPEILALMDAGWGDRAIARQVWGDEKYHRRVRTFRNA
jgi:transposase